jgi:hypothetical protein
MKLVALYLLVSTATGLSMEERMRALETKVENSVLPAGALLTFADGRTKCPVGYAEPAHLKGRMMTTVPVNGTSGDVFNRPLDAGELGRAPAHTHSVTVNDPGHTHVAGVNDPGHAHPISGAVEEAGYYNGAQTGQSEASATQTETAFTNITIKNEPAKSSVKVSIDANDAGEHYPLVYVLLCQKLP